MLTWIINAVYLIAAILFIVGLKAMSSPKTAAAGIKWAGLGMVLATVITFFIPNEQGALAYFAAGKSINLILCVVALGLGTGLATWLGKVVKMTDMPQMVAIYNGMGGGAAALIAAVEFTRPEAPTGVHAALAMLGALIGSVAFSGSVLAWAKLQGVMKRAVRWPVQNLGNVVHSLVTLALGVAIVIWGPHPALVIAFFLMSLILGLAVTSPIGGADMPVVISLLNAFTGLAVGLEGYVLGNPALIIAGIVVGAAGTLLTLLMAKAMNRPLSNVLFAPISGEAQAGAAVEGSMKELSAMDAAATMRYAQSVVIVPGYGMAVAGAQHKVYEMTKLLEGGRRRRQVRHPPRRGPHARPHERAAGRGRRPLRRDLRPRRDQRRLPADRRRTRDRRQRRGQPRRPHRQELAHLRHADSGRRPSGPVHRDQARTRCRLLRH